MEPTRGRAFVLKEVNLITGEVTIVIKKEVIGSISNVLLKRVGNNNRKSKVLCKLGYVLKECGNILYGNNEDKITIDSSIIEKTPQR